MDFPQPKPQGEHINKRTLLIGGFGLFVVFIFIFSFAYNGSPNTEPADSSNTRYNTGRANFLDKSPDSSNGFESLPPAISASKTNDSADYIPPPPDDLFGDPTEEVLNPDRSIANSNDPSSRQNNYSNSRPQHNRPSGSGSEEYKAFQEAQNSDGVIFDANENKDQRSYQSYNNDNQPSEGDISSYLDNHSNKTERDFEHSQHQEISSNFTQPSTPYTLLEGHLIPAVLETSINSEMPGNIRAYISRDVYDSIEMDYLLIPKGTRLIGSYDEKVVLNQSKLLMSWERMIFPDGRSIYLPDLNSYDLAGQSGLSGKVDRHFWKIFGQSAFLSLIGAGANAAAPPPRFGEQPSVSQQSAEQIAQEFNRTANRVLDRNLSMAPTIKISGGKQFQIFLAGDISFDEPYEYKSLSE